MLEKYGVQVIGVQVDAIKRGEDRQAFKDTMNRLGIEMPRSEIANSLEEAEKIVAEIGLPVRDPAGLHHGRHRRRAGLQHGGVPHRRRTRPRGQPGRADPGRGVGPRLGGTGTGGGPRRQEPDDHRLLHRERRRHGRAHRRLATAPPPC